MIYKVFDGSTNFTASYAKSHVEIFAAGVNAYLRNSVFKLNFKFTLVRQIKPQRAYFMRAFAH